MADGTRLGATTSALLALCDAACAANDAGGAQAFRVRHHVVAFCAFLDRESVACRLRRRQARGYRLAPEIRQECDECATTESAIKKRSTSVLRRYEIRAVTGRRYPPM